MAKRLIGYKEEDSWWHRFTVALAKRRMTKAEFLREKVRRFTEQSEAEDKREPNGPPGEGDE